uniref:Pco068771 n=1 Tax=Arundo donax TaxID=35708 RepID=A0A0A9GEL6_ARUDO
MPAEGLRVPGTDRSSPSGAPDGDPLHHALELDEIDASVAVAVDVADHLPHVGHAAGLGESQLLKHLLQLDGGDEAVAVHVEHLEGLLHLLLVIPLPAAALLVGGVVLVGERAEEGVPERAVEGVEVLEAEPRGALGDVGADGGGQAGVVGVEAERVQRLRQLVDGDLAIAVAVEEVEHAAEAHRVEAAVAEPERRRRRPLGQRRLHHRQALLRVHLLGSFASFDRP